MEFSSGNWVAATQWGWKGVCLECTKSLECLLTTPESYTIKVNGKLMQHNTGRAADGKGGLGHWTSFPSGSAGKESACNAGDTGDPGSQTFPGEGDGNPLQYFCLKNYINRGAWQAAVHGVAKMQTQLSN